jgi:hypothetical protein
VALYTHPGGGSVLELRGVCGDVSAVLLQRRVLGITQRRQLTRRLGMAQRRPQRLLMARLNTQNNKIMGLICTSRVVSDFGSLLLLALGLCRG